SRLIDMGVPAFLLANTLNVTVAQRLVRILCPACKKREPFDRARYPRKYLPSREVMEHCVPTGCDACHQTGYIGRRAIYEIIPIAADLAAKIKATTPVVDDELHTRGIK